MRARQAAFEDAFLDCGSGGQAARVRLQSHPYDAEAGTLEALKLADIASDCPAMAGLRRVYSVDGKVREDLVFSLLPPIP
jgi:hypothetical protein